MLERAIELLRGVSDAIWDALGDLESHRDQAHAEYVRELARVTPSHQRLL